MAAKSHREIKKQMNQDEVVLNADEKFSTQSANAQTHSGTGKSDVSNQDTTFCCPSIQRRRRFTVYVGLLLIASFNLFAFDAGQFKQALTNPPPSGRLYMDFIGSDELARVGIDRAIGTRFHIEWVDNNLRITQSLARTNKSGATNMFVSEGGEFEGKVWEHARNRTVFFDPGLGAVDDSIGGRFILATFRRLGIQYLIPSSIIWDEDRFSAKVKVDNHEFPISGKLVVDKSLNRVVGLEYKWDDTEMLYKVEYHYSPAGIETGFPSKIVIAGYGAVGGNPLMVYKISKFENKPDLTASSLNPSVLFPGAPKDQLTKDGLKSTLAAHTRSQTGPTTESSATIRRYVLCIFFLASCGVVWFVVRLGIKQKQ